MIWNKLESLGAREKVMLSLAALFIVAVVVDYLVAQPVLKRFKDLDSRIETQDHVYRDNRDIIDWAREVTNEYRLVSGSLTNAPSRAEAIEAMKDQVERLAAGAGVVPHSISHREPDSEKYAPCEEYFVEIKRFSADMESLLNFLYDLQAANGMPRVVSLNLTPRREDGVYEGSMLITKVMVPATGGN